MPARSSAIRSPWSRLFSIGVLAAAMLLSQCAGPRYLAPPQEHDVRRGVAATSPAATFLSASRVRIPFQLTENKMLLRAKINDLGPFLFQLDTGAEICVFQPELVRRLGLPLRPVEGQITTPAGDSLGVYQFASIGSVELGGARFENMDALVHELPIPYAGILNYGLFYDTIWAIDGPARRLEVFHADSVLPPDSSFHEFQIVHGVPVVSLNIRGREIPAILDSGFNQYFSFPASMASRLPLERPAVSFAQIQTLDARFNARIGRLAVPVRVGGWDVPRPVILLSRGSPLLGMGIMKYFRITLYPRAQRMRLDRPDGRPIEIPSVWGYAFRVAEESADGTQQIIEVVPGSRAWQAGLRENDIVVEGSRSTPHNGEESPYRLLVRRPGSPGIYEMIVPFEPLVP